MSKIKADRGSVDTVFGRAWVRLIFVGLAALLYLPTWLSLHNRWRHFDEFYSHGYPLLLVSLYLLWTDRDILLKSPSVPSWPRINLILLAGAGLLWLAASLALLEIVHQLMLPAILWLAVRLLLGNRAARSLLHPLLLFYLSVPVWDYLIPALQWAAAHVTLAALFVIGIPALRIDTSIHIPAGTVEIAGGCSGLSFLLVSLALSVLYCRLNQIRLRDSVWVILTGGLSGLFSNWLRVTSLTIIGHLTDLKHPLMHEHFNYGWLLFLICFFMTLFLWGRMPLRQHSAKAAELSLPDKSGADDSSTEKAVLAIMGCVMLLAPPFVYYALDAAPAGSRVATADVIAAVARNNWTETQAESWAAEFEGADQVLYLRPGRWPAATLQIVRYDHQAPGKKLISTQNNLFPDRFWRLDRRDRRSVENVVELILDGNAGQKRLLWYWYDIGGHQALQPLASKGLLLWARLQGRHDSALLALSLLCQSNCDAERSLLSETVTPARELYRTLYTQPYEDL